MNEERLKEIEARAAAAMPNRSAYESCHKDIPDLVAALRSEHAELQKAEAVVRAAYKLTDLPEYIGETWVDALDALDTALDDYARANQPPQQEATE